MGNGLDNSQNIIFLHKIIKNTCIFPPKCYIIYINEKKKREKDILVEVSVRTS